MELCSQYIFILFLLLTVASLSVHSLEVEDDSRDHRRLVTFIKEDPFWRPDMPESGASKFWNDIKLDTVFYMIVNFKNFTGLYPLQKDDNRFSSQIPVYYYHNGQRYQDQYNTEKIKYFHFENKSDSTIITLRLEIEGKDHSMHIEYLHKETAGSFCLDNEFSLIDNVTCSYLAFELQTKTLAATERIDSSHTEIFQKQPHKRSRRSLKQSKETKYVEIFIVCDQAMYEEFDSSIENVIQRVLDLIREVDSIFRHYNVRIVLDGIEIWSEENKIEVVPNGKIVLPAFAHYVEKNITHSDHVQLLTGFDEYINKMAGLAYVGYMCSLTWSTALTTDYQIRSLYSTSAVLAHEIGHNLGMSHDDSINGNCACADSFCIMNSGMVYPPAKLFSSCSVDSMNEFLESDRFLCLANEPDLTYYKEKNVCGNGIVEEGEQCDCGSRYFCTNPCCDSYTCLFKKHSECAHGECCISCRIASNSTLCRDVTDECDLPDYCDGEKIHCKDYHMEDGSRCSENGACYQGKCKSRDLQCRKIWRGQAQNAVDVCYTKLNKAGTSYGNCGKNEENDFKSCEEEHAQCGTLQCTNVMNEQAIGWRGWYVVIKLHLNNMDYKCVTGKTAGRQGVDHGHVHDWTPCGVNKYCFNQRCIEKEFPSKCINACGQNGVCSNDACYCFDGWGGETCSNTRPLRNSQASKQNSNDILLFIFLLCLTILHESKYVLYQ